MRRPSAGAMPSTEKYEPETMSAFTGSAAPSIAKWTRAGWRANIPSNTSFWAFRSLNSGCGSRLPLPQPLPTKVPFQLRSTSRSGSRTGSWRKRAWSTSEKIAEFAPTPRPIDSTATAVNPRSWSRLRRLCLRSWPSQSRMDIPLSRRLRRQRGAEGCPSARSRRPIPRAGPRPGRCVTRGAPAARRPAAPRPRAPPAAPASVAGSRGGRPKTRPSTKRDSQQADEHAEDEAHAQQQPRPCPARGARRPPRRRRAPSARRSRCGAGSPRSDVTP